MPVTYEKCDDDAPQVRVIRAMLQKYHGDLLEAGVTVECLVARSDDGPAVKHHGWPCFAKVKVMNLENRTGGSADARIIVDAAKWEDLHDDQSNALIDHELEHLELVKDARSGKTKRDDLDRPKLRCRPHDWELTGFDSVVRRHRDAAIEVRNVVQFVESESGQYVMEFTKVG